jgi:hypothetical protein
MYETKRSTWIIGALAGSALALGLMVAGDSYVRVAQTVAPYGIEVVRWEPVTITAQKKSAPRAEAAGTNAAGSAVGNASM